MGVCASTQIPTTRRLITAGSQNQMSASDRIRRLSTTAATAKVINAVDGRLHEFPTPIQAKQITSKNPNFFLCSAETMSVGACLIRAAEEEELQSGQIYFLLPESRAQKPLSLPDLCSLAITASSALCKSQPATVDRISSRKKSNSSRKFR
ncbi:hypothetical protein F8388_017024 [Cannabis sativa]|uniref:Uncharacterized protein n=1 Tax=Cannabis sativa TaxID=3483 RepID=A0A7J6HD54_CANSA|nr:hypothetical protein F8388_017024 [Cannabis sativa]KAF4393202.1 hypothetical protein G4B88_001936 [Cannabis sativa]